MGNDIFLDMSKPGDYIIPQAYSIFHEIDMGATQLKLEEYCRQGLIKRMYEFVCPRCGCIIGVYNSLNELETIINCGNLLCSKCGAQFSVFGVVPNLKIIYKKV